MESMEASVVVVVPPGFRFHPTEEELVGYYLKKKVAAQKIDLDVIREIDLYRIEPWDLQDRCWIGYEEQNEWYFFSHKDKKYPTGTRTNRATMAGFWKATGRDKAVYEKMRLIGMRKTLVFYKGRAPNGHKTDWIMHEYRLESDENGSPQEEGWVVCKAFKKRATGQTRNNERGSWESSCFYDEAGGISSILDPIEYISRKQPRPQSFICKQELEADNLILLESDHYVQLPQLERSPSLPVLTRQNIMSLVSENVEYEEQMSRCNNMEKRVTDWRALDKFVASQLSHDEERDDGEGVSNFGDSCNDNSDMALILPQNSSTTSGREQEDYKLNGFLNSSSDCDFGICIFDK